MVYIREEELRNVKEALRSLDEEQLSLLLHDYAAMRDVQDEVEREITPLKNKIRKLQEKVAKKRKVQQQYRRLYWKNHLKQFRVNNGVRSFWLIDMVKWEEYRFSNLEQAIKKLATKWWQEGKLKIKD